MKGGGKCRTREGNLVRGVSSRDKIKLAPHDVCFRVDSHASHQAGYEAVNVLKKISGITLIELDEPALDPRLVSLT